MAAPLSLKDLWPVMADRPETCWPGPLDAQDRLVPRCVPVHRPAFTLTPRDRLFPLGTGFARLLDHHLVRAGMINAGDSRRMAGRLPGREALWRCSPAGLHQALACALTPGDPEALFPPGVGGAEATALRTHFAAAAEAEVIVISLAQVHVLRDRHTGLARDPWPADLTERQGSGLLVETLDYQACRAHLEAILDLLTSRGPAKRVVLTVSPEPPHRLPAAEDAMVAAMEGMATLRTVMGALARDRPRVDYFPVYEAVMYSERHAVFGRDQRHVRADVGAALVRDFLTVYLGTTAPPGHVALDARQFLAQGRPGVALAQLQHTGDQQSQDHLRDLAFAAVEAGAVAEAEQALHALDRQQPAVGEGGDSVATALTLAERAVAAWEEDEAAARVRSLAARHADAFLPPAGNDHAQRLVRLLAALRRDPLAESMDSRALLLHLTGRLNRATDVALRGETNQAIAFFNRGEPERARATLAPFLRRHPLALAQPDAEDLLPPLRGMAEALDLSELAAYCDAVRLALTPFQPHTPRYI